MAGGLTVSVRQIGSYPTTQPAIPSDLVLTQRGGLGGPYLAPTAYDLITQVLADSGPLGVGIAADPNTFSSQIIALALSVPPAGQVFFNAYVDNQDVWRYLRNGPAGSIGPDGRGGMTFANAGIGAEGAAITGGAAMQSVLMGLSAAGALSLPHGTLSVARDPASALEVATMGWVGASTVASFNGRRGVVTLSAADVYCALGLDPCDPFATVSWVNAQICGTVSQAIATTPMVRSFNGRVGNVFLNTCDLNIATFTGPPTGLPPLMVPTPPLSTATPPPDPSTVVNIAWVTQQQQGMLEGYATEAWVLEQLQTVNVGVMSWNGRSGAVTLQLSDVTQVGGAPSASPTFSGYVSVPTPPPGTSDAQAASTAFVQQAIQSATAGVASFNGRTGAVTLNTADITGAGGAPLASPVFTGVPAGPTAAAGTSTTQLATTQFVASAIAGLTGVNSFNGRSGVVTLTSGDLTGAGGALLASPSFTGNPSAPTPPAGDNDTSIATTAFVTAAINTAVSGIESGVTSFNGRTGAVTLNTNDISAAGGLTNPSPGLTGTPTAPTAAPGTNTTQLATTAFVEAAIAANPGGVTSFNTRTGAVSLVLADVTGVGGAPTASPALTGTPTAPTAVAGTSTTQLATTAFVMNAISGVVSGVSSFNTRTGAVTLAAADITGAGGALLASPALTGTPTAPTAAVGTSTTQLATTAFVQAAIAAGGVTSFNGRSGAVTLTLNDVTSVGGAPLASPNFSGVPTAPTAAAGTSSTQLATTAFVTTALAGLSPTVVSATAPATPGQGQLWWNTNDGQGYVWTGQQWVVFVNPPMGLTQGQADARYLQLSGGTLTGPVTMATNAASLRMSTATTTVDGGKIIFPNTVSGTNNFQLFSNTANNPPLIGFNTGGNYLWSLNNGGDTTCRGATFTGNIVVQGGATFNSGFTSGQNSLCQAALGVGPQTAWALGTIALLQAQNTSGTAAAFYCNAPGAATLMRVDTTNAVLCNFQFGSTQVGTISTNTANTSYNTSSDGRLKGNVAPIENGGGLIDQLAPVSFEWTSNPSLGTDYGFIAQDVESVFPMAVTAGSGNPGDADFRPYGMDLSKLVPLLVAAVKALRARVAALEANASLAPAVPVAA